MKLLIDIDDQLFQEVRHLTKAKTKKEAIVISMKEFINQHKKRKLAEMIGDFEMGMTLSDLQRMRDQWKKS